jgi:hypothetical protein
VNHLPILITSTPLTLVAAADPTTLWPPNGRTVNVGVSGHVAGGTSSVGPTSGSFAVSDEYASVQPSGSFAVHPDGTFAFTVPLDAFRNGTDKDGRTYTIRLLVNDQAGNAVSQSLVVTVLHDQGNQAASVPVTTATGGGAPGAAPVPATDLISLLASDVATLPKGKSKK